MLDDEETPPRPEGAPGAAPTESVPPLRMGSVARWRTLVVLAAVVAAVILYVLARRF